MSNDKTIWKYELSEDQHFQLNLPAGAIILCVQIQNGRPCIWAEVDPRADRNITRHFAWVGTGHIIPENAFQYIGTIQPHPFVFHLYEVRDEQP